jgi:hypothetical protein
MPKRRQNKDLRLMQPPTSKPVRSISLKSPLHCQRYLSKLVNEIRRGETESGEATKIGYLVGLLLKSFETVQLETRINEIEKKLGESDET